MKIQIPETADGETYIGSISDKNGDVQHIVLLPGDNDRASWEDQMKWAKSIGGDLPTRVEQALMFATVPDLFEKAAYWSNEEDKDDPGWAWCQYFSSGFQDYFGTSHRLRARAVRRLKI